MSDDKRRTLYSIRALVAAYNRSVINTMLRGNTRSSRFTIDFQLDTLIQSPSAEGYGEESLQIILGSS